MTSDRLAEPAALPAGDGVMWLRHRLLDALALLATVLAVGALYLPSSDEPPALSRQRYSLESLRAASVTAEHFTALRRHFSTVPAGSPSLTQPGVTPCRRSLERSRPC